jgi:Fur family transcriptional regulator, peroxide stress response regulator
MDKIAEILKENSLKNTPQRYYILKAIFDIEGHPTVDEISTEVHKSSPNISIGTIYNILSLFVDKNILNKVKTDSDTMRFELCKNNHHHLYSCTDERIEDYYDEKLDMILKEYFEKNKILNFDIKEIKLQLIGDFRENK